jgi:hypothetical protein
MNALTDLERGWLAGILEGEGCITRVQRKRQSRPAREGHTSNTGRWPVRDEINWMVQVNMTDFDIIQRLHTMTGVGRVRPVNGRPHYATGNMTKPMLLWNVQVREDVLALLLAVRPMLGERRGARADEALAELPGLISNKAARRGPLQAVANGN